MTIELPADLEDPIRTEVLRGHYPDENAMVAAILREHLHRQSNQPPANLDEPESNSSEPKSFWEEIAELRKSVPDEEWDKLPADGAAQLDHYLTGAPKRPKR